MKVNEEHIIQFSYKNGYGLHEIKSNEAYRRRKFVVYRSKFDKSNVKISQGDIVTVRVTAVSDKIIQQFNAHIPMHYQKVYVDIVKVIRTYEQIKAAGKQFDRLYKDMLPDKAFYFKQSFRELKSDFCAGLVDFDEVESRLRKFLWALDKKR